MDGEAEPHPGPPGSPLAHITPPHHHTHSTSTWLGPLLWSELLPLLYFPRQKALEDKVLLTPPLPPPPWHRDWMQGASLELHPTHP